MRTTSPFRLILLATLISGCSGSDSSISAGIAKQITASESAPVNLALVGPEGWSRMCVLGPYSNNATAEKVLGFKWDLERHSSIGRNDGVSLLVFHRESQVLAIAEHPRDKGNFLSLSPPCVERSKATLKRRVHSGGWVQLVAE